MIVHDVEQGSGDWYRLRMGRPSASEAHRIVTPKTCALSAQSVEYAYRLLAERLLNTPMQSVEGVAWMERGKEMEPYAAKSYEFIEGVETVPVGFITTDDGLIGASPDRLIKGRAAGLEIKAPSPPVHLRYLLEGHDEKYRPQVQCQALVCDFEYVDFYSYSDRMPPRLIRTVRDELYINQLARALAEFNERLAAMEAKARELGAFQAHSDAATPLDEQERIRGEVDRAFDPRYALREA